MWRSSLLRGAGWLALGLLLLVHPAWAQLPEPPRESEFAVRFLPAPSPLTPDQRENLEDHPLVDFLGKLGAKHLGFDPLGDLAQTLEGTMVGAVLPGPQGSSLVRFLEDKEAREKHRRMISELDELIADLETYKEGAGEGRYPTDYQAYIDEHRYYEPYLGFGVEHRYEPLGEGTDYRLKVIYTDDTDMGQFGPPPSYHSKDGRQNFSPQKDPVPLNYVLAARVKDAAKARRLTTLALGEPLDGFWRGGSPDDLQMIATLRGDWWVAADRMSNLGPLLDSLQGRGPGLSANPRFQTVARNIDMNSAGYVFLDLPRIARSITIDDPQVDARLVHMVGPLGYSVIPYEGYQYRIEAFLGLEPPEGSDLASYFASTVGSDPELQLNFPNIPWDVANIVGVDVKAVKELLDAAVALYPDAVPQYEMGEDVMAGMLGIDAQKGFAELLDQPALISFERIDIYLMGFSSFLEKVDALGAPPEEESQDPPPKPLLSYFPATAALSVPDADNREAVTKTLRKRMSPEVTERTIEGVTVHQAENSAYAVHGDWIYLSGRNTERLMRNMLEATQGRKQTLSQIPTWSQFQLRQRGRLLLFGHHKLDAFYSVAKGFLLFLGADFRPLATEIGQLRDYHTVMTAVPDGVVLVGEILEGDGR